MILLYSMVIRLQQMEAFGRAQSEAFFQRTMRHFSNYFPRMADGPQWEIRLRDSLRRAEAEYGLKHERDLSAFADLCGGLGWDFDRQPENAWMAACLNDRVVTRPEDRMKALLRLLERRREVTKRNAAARESFAKR